MTPGVVLVVVPSVESFMFWHPYGVDVGARITALEPIDDLGILCWTEPRGPTPEGYIALDVGVPDPGPKPLDVDALRRTLATLTVTDAQRLAIFAEVERLP